MSERRPRVAYWSPLAPSLSGIADYSEELLPHLAELWDVDLFVSGGAPTAPALAGFDWYDGSCEDALPRLAAYDATLYQVGNAPAHETIYRTLLRWPGLVVLHDFDLQNLILERSVGRGRPDLYIREMREQHGDEAAERARRVVFGDDAPLHEADPLRFPANRRVLANATGILVHSRFVERLVRAGSPGCPVVQLDHHALPPDEAAAPAPRDDGAVVFTTAGYLTPTKQVGTVLRALARIRDRLDFRYRLVGRVAPGFDPTGEVRRLGLEGRVDLVGHVDKPGLYRELATADVCVNLRRPTLGETSGIVMRALACGRPVVVSDAGWFAELPDACCPKVAPGGPGDDGVEGALAELLLDLGRRPERRARLAAAAGRYAAARDLPSRARGYDLLLRAAAEAGRRPLESEASRRLSELGIDPEPGSRRMIGERVRSLRSC